MITYIDKYPLPPLPPLPSIRVWRKFNGHTTRGSSSTNSPTARQRATKEKKVLHIVNIYDGVIKVINVEEEDGELEVERTN